MSEPLGDGDGLPRDGERAEALRLLSLLRDGRPVEPAAAARARRLAERDPELGAMLAAGERRAALLASDPPVAAGAGFTGRVLAALREQRAAPAEVLALPLVKRLVAAAALLLAVTLGWSLAHPAALRAAPDPPRHAVDHFRRTPFAPDDLLAGLRGRLLDTRFVERPGHAAFAEDGR